MNWIFKQFDELSLKELYDILQLRNDVFVVEQECPYLDLDGLKDKSSTHLFLYQEDTLAAYCRIVPAGISYTEESIGRVVVHKKFRNKQLGKLLMQQAIDFVKKEWNSEKIRISAQAYLQKFYIDLGFEQVSEIYLEDDIPHMEMLYKEG
ncbi:GNAT family N-acetyltransferase [Algivirga pacifica]|uniref:GNAT family N-acetyltransferase n=1 Tax=Algivirga pacifica TaxID=1162670 RepID=A0ABP9D116_9BACT